MGRQQKYLPHPLGLSVQEIFEKRFFAGVESAPGIYNYPTVEIESLHHRTSSDNTTIYTLVKYAVDQATEAIDASNKKWEGREKTMKTQDHLCNYFRQEGQTYVHKNITEEKFFMTPNKKVSRPPWATKKLKKLELKSNPINDDAWDWVE